MEWLWQSLAGLTRSDQIALAALTVALVAALVAMRAASYAGTQAQAATRADLRTELREIENGQHFLDGIVATLHQDLAVARASKSAYFRRGGGPAMNRAPPPLSAEIARIARNAVRYDELAGIKLLPGEIIVMNEIVAADALVIRNLTYVFDGMASGSIEGQTAQHDLGAEQVIGDLAALEPKLRAVVMRLQPLLDAKRKGIKAELQRSEFHQS